MKVEIHGHTDNAGDPAKNMTLSEQRAFAVKQWLEAKSPESLVAQKDITDASTGLVKYKKGTKLTFDEFATNEVLKITAAMTGQSFDMSG